MGSKDCGLKTRAFHRYLYDLRFVAFILDIYYVLDIFVCLVGCLQCIIIVIFISFINKISLSLLVITLAFLF